MTTTKKQQTVRQTNVYWDPAPASGAGERMVGITAHHGFLKLTREEARRLSAALAYVVDGEGNTASFNVVVVEE